MTSRLKTNQIKPYRTDKLEEQSYTCPITNSEITTDEACLDHDHDTGFCREVLPRNINTAEGKIKSVYVRWVKKRGISLPEFLRNLADYLDQDYSENPLHPTHLTPEEKKEKARKKRARARKKKA